MSIIARSSTLQVRLEVAHHRANVKGVVLKRDAVIGRSTDCNLRIASKLVSRQHCKIRLNGKQVYVRDLDSSNGTFLDGRRIEPHRDVPVPSGTELSLGGVKFIVRYDAPPAAEQPAPAVNGHAKAGLNGSAAAAAAAVPIAVAGASVAAASPPSPPKSDEPLSVVLDDEDLVETLPVEAAGSEPHDLPLGLFDDEVDTDDIPLEVADAPMAAGPSDGGISDDEIADFLSEMPASSSPASQSEDDDLGDFLGTLGKD